MAGNRSVASQFTGGRGNTTALDTLRWFTINQVEEMRTHFTQIAQLCCTVRENNSFFEPLKAMHRATVGPKMGLRVLNITRQLFMKVETKNKKSGLHRFLTYREDFWAPKGTQRALTGPKKGRRVLKHHQTTFYEGRNKKQKILVASIFDV